MQRLAALSQSILDSIFGPRIPAMHAGVVAVVAETFYLVYACLSAQDTACESRRDLSMHPDKGVMVVGGNASDSGAMLGPTW